MIHRQRLLITATTLLLGQLVACSSNNAAGGTADVGSGGAGNGAGGTAAVTGGAATAGMGGLAPSSGGAYGTGGASAGTGGVQQGTGGIQNGTGGATGTGTKATGGAGAATGGALGTGGASAATGGKSSAGGTSAATGGRSSTGGTGAGTGGAVGTGGIGVATGGKSSTGGAATGGAATGGATSIDPNVSAAVSACMDKLPYGGNLLSASARAPIITAIIKTCAAFAPPGADWQTWCQMFLVGAINAESSFDTQAGATGAAGDPSVGLLQIRFSSVVTDFANYGPIDTLTQIGCNFGTVTSSDSYATKGAMMLDVNCNIAIGAWYYFIFASGNGGSDVVWVDQYCLSGAGVAGNLHIGMASFLMGGIAAHTSLSGADSYVNEIKGWFDQCVTYSGTHPFELPIQPDVGKYCR